MRQQTLIAAIALVICIPLAFRWLGGEQSVGLIIGVVLVVGGLALGFAGHRQNRDLDG